ncbi:DUF4129 domain-containing protein [Spirosoma agri]|uniref:DUF4129 domain-containing protein n=1 Tax=Spirosoma agri TaxID=1987381 RepID=A0A6M0IKL5_9BACT|nr:DUF4129 domain-containing protein [Spirosoma agri]NEU68828.1 DUF4129 domain-containing protein [Spirosoma agri]
MKVVFKTYRLLWAATLIMLLACASVPLSAQPTKPISQSVAAPDDRSPVRVRYPTPEKIRDYQTDHDYQYDNEGPPPENPVARILNWLYRRFVDFLNSAAYKNVWQYAILAGVAAAVIYLLMKAEVLGELFSKRAQPGGLDYENLVENIHEIDFDTVIDEAISQGNFRLAVRLSYLQTLKRLTDSGLIVYKPDKTNRQYVYELANTTIRADFEELTRQFEFIWYGNFPVNEASFQAVRQQFTVVNQAVSQPNTVKRTGSPVKTDVA